MSVREANQNFSKLIGLVEQGETVVISKRGRTVATVSPAAHDKTKDPKWQAAHARIVEHLKSRPREGEPLGRITMEDKYGDADS
jgi:prevent-host-death family protein